jgi:tetratricopeptide (TPR) repeat protein
VQQASLLGHLYHAAGLQDAAYEALVLAAGEGDHSEPTLRVLGQICLARGEYREAEELLEAVLGLQPEGPQKWSRMNAALLGYLTALTAQGKDELAEPLWQQLMCPPPRQALRAV